MTTLLLPPRQTDDAQLIWRAAVSAGWSTMRLPAWTVPDDIGSRDLAYYGEPLLAARVAEVLRVCFVEPQLDWLTTLPHELRRRRIWSTTLSEARLLEGRHFVKPADDKAFAARVYESGAEIDASEMYEVDLPVLVSDPVRFTLEYRAFILERSVQAVSLYCREGQVVEFPEGFDPSSDVHFGAASSFLQRVLADDSYFIAPAVVLDVGLLDSGDWAVIECNPAWGSGIYGCDPTAVLPVLKRACVPAEVAQKEDPRSFAVRRSRG